MPDSQECKLRAIDALSEVESMREGADLSAAAMLIGLAQVWATLATVPDVLTEEMRREPPAHQPNPPHGPGMAGWRSPGGAGQWNG